MLDSADPSVRLAGAVIPLESLRARPRRYTDQFLAARATDGHALCLCTEPAPRLVIRARSEKFFLSGWPDRGFEHAHGCPFHKVIPELTGSSGYTDGAIVEDEDGTRILLDVPLVMVTKDRPVGTFEPLPNARSDGSAASRASLLGLLHWLWEAAQLNRWAPGTQRDWDVCREHLVHQAGDCKVTDQRGAHALAEFLYVVPRNVKETREASRRALQAFTERLGEHKVGDRYVTRHGLLLGELLGTYPGEYGGFRCRIDHLPRQVIADAPLLTRARNSYRAALGDSRPPGALPIVLMLVTRITPADPKKAADPGAGYLKAVDMAAMLTTKTYVPADSSHEIAMATALADASRSFVKPLRYDAAAETFPDFALLDCDPPVYVEVYGITGNAAYEARKQAKAKHYRETGRPVIEWDINDPLPDLTTP